MISKIEHFTAAIQLITAVNFTFILAHLPRIICIQILRYDRACHENFKLFREKMLSVIENDVKNMKAEIIGNVDTSIHKNKLLEEVKKIKEKWDGYEKKFVGAIRNICFVKGIKCLFLFISVYCVFDLIAIPTLNQWDKEWLKSYMTIINISFALYSLRISWIILRAKWNTFSDSKCYAKITLILFLIFLVIVPIWAIVYFLIATDCMNVTIQTTWEIAVWCCLLLPFYPYLFTIMYIAFSIFYVNIRRLFWKLYLRCRIWDLKRKKKKFDNAYSTLLNIDWR